MTITEKKTARMPTDGRPGTEPQQHTALQRPEVTRDRGNAPHAHIASDIQGVNSLKYL